MGELRQRIEYHRDKKLRSCARGKPCMAMFPWCNGNPETVVWCHSNQSSDGKGGAIKAHDCMGFFGCSACNGPDPRERKVREEAEDTAMRRTRAYMMANAIATGITVNDVRDPSLWLRGWQSGRIKVA
jgi:hypothetical protein